MFISSSHHSFSIFFSSYRSYFPTSLLPLCYLFLNFIFSFRLFIIYPSTFSSLSLYFLPSFFLYFPSFSLIRFFLPYLFLCSSLIFFYIFLLPPLFSSLKCYIKKKKKKTFPFVFHTFSQFSLLFTFYHSLYLSISTTLTTSYLSSNSALPLLSLSLSLSPISFSFIYRLVLAYSWYFLNVVSSHSRSHFFAQICKRIRVFMRVRAYDCYVYKLSVCFFSAS